jgi:hypothetical protein
VSPEPLTALVVAGLLAIVAERLVAGLVTPLFTKFKLDTFYLLYVSWAVGGVLVYLSGANLFAAYIPNPLTGQILSAVVAGGGANLIHDIFGSSG